jgi:hypothetical protein
MNIPNLTTIIAFLAAPASAFAVFMYASNLFRNLRSEGHLTSFSPWALQIITAGVPLVLCAAAMVIVQTVPPSTLIGLEPYWQLVAIVAMSYIGQQVWYKNSKTEG